MRNIDQKNKKLRVLTAALAAAVLALLLPGAVLAQDAAAAHGMPPDCAAVSSDVGEISLYPGGMPFGVKSLEKRQNELVQKLFPEGGRGSGINATRLVVRALELRILDIDNLYPDE